MSYRIVRLLCSATGVDIGNGWGLFVSAQDNDLGVDRIADGHRPQEGVPLPSTGEIEAAKVTMVAVRVEVERLREQVAAVSGESMYDRGLVELYEENQRLRAAVQAVRDRMDSLEVDGDYNPYAELRSALDAALGGERNE